MNTFKVLQAGFQVTFQDLGRHGQQQYGLAPAGALDETSLIWANWALGNSLDACGLEIPFGQFALLVLEDCHAIVTGADLGVTLNNRPAPRYQVLPLQAGDQIKWHRPHSGIRAYLAIAGGFDSERFFASQSINLRENLGQALHSGQYLKIHTPSQQLTDKSIPQSAIPTIGDVLRLRFLPGGQWQDFSSTAQQTFLKQTFQLSHESNRTGCRLSAASPIASPYQKMISEGIPYGTIQLPPNGQPIILLKDRPTIGGYPKLGTVLSFDLDRLAQAAPKTKIQFEIISLEKALRLKQKWQAFFQQT